MQEPSPAREAVPAQPAPEHPLLEALRSVNPDAMTPLDALRLLSDWKMLWGAPAKDKAAAPDSAASADAAKENAPQTGEAQTSEAQTVKASGAAEAPHSEIAREGVRGSGLTLISGNSEQKRAASGLS